MKLTFEEKVIAGVAILLLVIFGAWWIHRDGEKAGAVSQEIKASAVVVEAEKADVAVELKKSVAKKTEYHAARAKVVLKGDTVVADGQSVVQPSVADLVRKADARGDQDSTSMAKQDLLVAGLDHHVDLLQEEKKPRIGFKTGVAIGVVGTAVVVYVAVKIIRAVAHK